MIGTYEGIAHLSGGMECSETNCENEAGVRLHVPWAENRVVCPACARSLVQQDGVVAEPLEDREDAWR